MRYVSLVAGVARGLVGKMAWLGAAVVMMPLGLWGQWQTNGSVVSVPAGTSVGIGTSAPSHPLSVNGLIDWGNNIGVLSWDGSANAYISAAHGIAFAPNNGSATMFIAPSGNTGIGTTAPTQTLTVAGPYGLPASSGTVQNSLVRFQRSDGGANVLDFGINATVSPYAIWMQTGGTTNLAWTYPLALQPNGGNVGIGTMNPQHLLHVAGTIGATQIIVSATGADYVFSPTYRLQPLPEVASYIKANGHLPGIPAAEEVEAQGVNLGDMQSKLLAKVEELTLHMIAADERNNRLEKQNRELQERLARLEAGQGTH